MSLINPAKGSGSSSLMDSDGVYGLVEILRSFDYGLPSTVSFFRLGVLPALLLSSSISYTCTSLILEPENGLSIASLT